MNGETSNSDQSRDLKSLLVVKTS